MKRQLPLIKIEGTLFYVDVLHDCLRQKLNFENRIPFDAFDQDGDGYTFLYDKKLRNAAEDQEMSVEIKRCKRVTIPALMELDPHAIALKYHIPLEILCPELASEGLSEDEEDNFYTEDIF